MRPARRGALALAFVGLSAATAARGQSVDPYYAEIERQGMVAFERGRATDAARLLRTACFGRLDFPESLAPCLVRLAKAQLRAGDGTGFVRSFERLEQLEERFGVVRTLSLDAGDRQELAAAIRERIDPTLLAGSPIAFLAGERLPVGDAEGRDADQQKSQPWIAESAPASETPEATPPPSAVDESAATSAANDATIAHARELLSGTPAEPELAAALERLQPLAAAEPADRELQELVAILAYRASRWPLCAEHFRRGGESDAERPLVSFYMAVCYFETGDRAGAAAVLQPALERLKRTPFVESYVAKILGGASGAP